jgi:citrate lyase subunit beta / citryl-CoA lyase
MKPYRSLLFVPGNRQRMLDKAPTLGADAILIDLEDAVGIADKDAARAMVRDTIPAIADPPVLVRINAVSTGLAAEDLDAVVMPGLSGIFVAKVEGPDEVHAIGDLLDDRELAAGVPAGSVELVCMLESARSVRLAYEIATASPRVASVCFSSGQNGDLQTDLGCDWSIEGTEMLYARSKTILDARAGGIDHPLDGVYVGIADIDGLVADTTLSKRLGYRGRAIIHPSHIDTVNRIYSPSVEEVRYYRGLLEAFDEAIADGRGSTVYEGRMIDVAMAVRARRVLDLAQRLGVAD